MKQAREVLARLHGEYEQAYYAGIICERRAKAHRGTAAPARATSPTTACARRWTWYEKAEALRPPGNDDATLRWNTCARILMSHPSLQAGPQERWEPPLE